MKIEEELSLYEHQEYINGEYHNKYLYVHNDQFSRTFANKKEIEKHFENTKEKTIIEIISNSLYGINVFLLTIITKEPIEELNELSYLYMLPDDVKYYTIVPCNFNRTEVK